MCAIRKIQVEQHRTRKRLEKRNEGRNEDMAVPGREYIRALQYGFEPVASDVAHRQGPVPRRDPPSCVGDVLEQVFLTAEARWLLRDDGPDGGGKNREYEILQDRIKRTGRKRTTSILDDGRWIVTHIARDPIHREPASPASCAGGGPDTWSRIGILAAGASGWYQVTRQIHRQRVWDAGHVICFGCEIQSID